MVNALSYKCLAAFIGVLLIVSSLGHAACCPSDACQHESDDTDCCQKKSCHSAGVSESPEPIAPVCICPFPQRDAVPNRRDTRQTTDTPAQLLISLFSRTTDFSELSLGSTFQFPVVHSKVPLTLWTCCLLY